jgi:cell division protein FtsI (penicillin-binding protein 3)
MAGMYQAIANDGVRIPPRRIIKAPIAADGTTTPEEAPEGIRVVSPETGGHGAAHAARHRQLATRAGSAWHRLARPAVEGYQIAGKTAPPSSQSRLRLLLTTITTGSPSPAWSPSDNPRYVIGIWPTQPARTADGDPGTTWPRCSTTSPPGCCSGRNVPLSAEPGPRADLQVE